MSESTPAALPPEDRPIQPEPSSGAAFWDLFFRPTRFFLDHIALGRTPQLVLVTFVYGLAAAIDRLATEHLKAEARGRNSAGLEAIFGHWPVYWGLALALGVLGAALLWQIGGWWYVKRLTMCGVPDPDKRRARTVYVYASFVWAAPTVLDQVVETARYPNYIAAQEAASPWSLLLLVFIFWAIVASHRGVRANFPVEPGRARIWFLILPFLLSALLLVGVFAAFFAMGAQEG